MSMRTIDDELDEVISGCFTTLESFFAEHAQLQPMMKKSFFELSQARRASVEVGRTSFDMAMVALTTALCEGDGIHAPRLTLRSEINTSTQEQQNEHNQHNEDGTRRRKGNDKEKKSEKEKEKEQEKVEEKGNDKEKEKEKEKKESGAVDYIAMMKNSSHTEESQGRKRNPLCWFGMLRPPILKQTQDSFLKATEQLIVIANLKLQIMTYLAQYEELMKKKSSKSV
eukprot:TRINITY_DN713_c0_g1_i2.p1 TRINITY_DN713_c0_g1~~TRINITY_DN713_c0_g1_i2.p1  ORF type:complete len:237 (-),score=91.58 TRINITY_DN713_c0_g1_i2:33-710(-)